MLRFAPPMSPPTDSTSAWTSPQLKQFSITELLNMPAMPADIVAAAHLSLVITVADRGVHRPSAMAARPWLPPEMVPLSMPRSLTVPAVQETDQAGVLAFRADVQVADAVSAAIEYAIESPAGI